MTEADLLATALDAVTDAVVVCGDDGVVLHANRCARTLFGPDGPANCDEISDHPRAGAARERRVNGVTVWVIPTADAGTLSLADRERQTIEQALTETGWQLSLTARKLGISRTTLWRRLKSYGLRRPETEGGRA